MTGGINRPIFPGTGATAGEQQVRTGLKEIVRQFLDSNVFLARLFPGDQLRVVSSGVPVPLKWGSMNRVPNIGAIQLQLPPIQAKWVGVPLQVTKSGPTGVAFVSVAGLALDGKTRPQIDGVSSGLQITTTGTRTFMTDGANWSSSGGGTGGAVSVSASGVFPPSSTFKLSGNYSPIGLWQFNETLTDSSGRVQPALVAERGNVRYTSIFPGSMGILCGGATGLILRLPHTGVASLLRQPGDVSVQVIMQQFSETLTDAAGSSPLLGYRGAGGSAQDNNSLWGLFQGSEYVPDWYTESGAGVGFSHFILTPVTPPPAVRTVLFGARRQSNEVQFFLDGKPFGTTTTGTTPDGGASGLFRIGGQLDESAAPNMLISSLKVCNQALSDAQFLADYNASLGQYYGPRT